MNFSVEKIETELKKRLKYPYQWGKKQNDTWDAYTKFVYETLSWEALLPKMAEAVEKHNLDKRSLFNYTINRWFNFWSAVAVEAIFNQSKLVQKAEIKNSEVDFYIHKIPFDHKTSIFPKRFQKSFKEAQENERELIVWLYKNQSKQQRFHLKNRLFIVVYNTDGEHWKLKAYINLLKNAIENYLTSFTLQNLHSLTFANGQHALSDIIWVSK